MVNITHKNNTLRKAIATAILTVSKQTTIDAIREKKVAKGDVFEFSRNVNRKQRQNEKYTFRNHNKH
jgi:molybdenum cofactor biosynthesis enzyme